MANATELVTKLTFEGTPKPLLDYNDALKASAGIAMKAGVSILGTATALGIFSDSQLNAIDGLNDLSETINTSIESIQELSYIAQLSGSSTEVMQGSLRQLAQQIGRAAVDGVDAFDRLGISAKDANGKTKDTVTIFGELRDKIKSLTAEEQLRVLRELRLDPSLLQTLRLSADEFENLRKEAQAFGVVSKEQAKIAADYNDSLDRTKYVLNQLGNQLALSLAPAMKIGSDGFRDFLIANKDLINNGIEVLNTSLSSVFQVIENFSTAIDQVITNTIGWENALGALSVAVLYLNRALLMNPIGIVIGLIVGLLLVVDDLVVGFQGGESVIVNFFKGFDIDIVNRMIDGFNIMKATLASLLNITIYPLIEAFLALNVATGKFANFAGMSFDTSGAEATLAKFQAFREAQSSIGRMESGMTSYQPSFANGGENLMPNYQNRSVSQTNEISIAVSSSDPYVAGMQVANSLDDVLTRQKNNALKGGF